MQTMKGFCVVERSCGEVGFVRGTAMRCNVAGARQHPAADGCCPAQIKWLRGSKQWIGRCEEWEERRRKG